MGLAASQSRFLGLTARKSNVEYKGQQINQARTALSNEVNNLYQKYNRLDVPVPPVKQDYVKTKYTLDSTNEDFSISNFSKITSGDNEGYYNVTLEYNESISKLYTFPAKDAVVSAKKTGDEYTYINFQIGKEAYTYDSTDNKASNVKKIVVTGEEGDTTAKQYQGLEDLLKKYDITSGTFYMFIRNGMAHYTTENDLVSTFEDIETDEDNKQMYYGTYSFDYLGSMNKSSTVQAIAAISQNSSGRLTSIQIIDSEDEIVKPMIGSAYSVSTSTEDDEVGYSDAMNQYNYQKAVYERQVELLNKKTESLQKEDRALELQLDQLDTEQKALATEMESVQKVIEKTIDSVFKTYNS